jgi:hypothetical protein
MRRSTVLSLPPQLVFLALIFTVPVDERLDKLATVQLIVAIGVVHLEVVKLPEML